MAESRMTETVTFFTEEDAIDEETLQPIKVETPIAGTVDGKSTFNIPARLKAASKESRDVEIAGQEPVVSALVLSVPSGSIRVGPSVFVQVSASTSDPSLAGVRVRTKDFPAMGQTTAWRYPVEQVS
jgi:hypothetical protein